MSKRNILAELVRYPATETWDQRIADLPYPFLCPLPRGRRHEKWQAGIERINQMGQEAFGEAAPDISMVGRNQLEEWQLASPLSWLVLPWACKGKVAGYVHVEPLSKTRAELLRDGHCNEGDIIPADIVPENRLRYAEYIHIGSIVRSYSIAEDASRDERKAMAACLLAGIVDRVQRVHSLSRKAARFVIAVDYPDLDGHQHATQILRRCGFQHQSGWQVHEGNDSYDVYVLDLDRKKTAYLDNLWCAVEKRRAFYLKRRKWMIAWSLCAVGLLSLLIAGYTSFPLAATLADAAKCGLTCAAALATVLKYLAEADLRWLHKSKRRM